MSDENQAEQGKKTNETYTSLGRLHTLHRNFASGCPELRVMIAPTWMVTFHHALDGARPVQR